MALYCGIDLHSSNNYVAILDEELRRVAEQRLPNDLGAVLRMLGPYRKDLQGIAVESTFNWYWLVDGLMEDGYRLHLTNTSAVKQYEGLKYSDDRHDARWLARLLMLGSYRRGTSTRGRRGRCGISSGGVRSWCRSGHRCCCRCAGRSSAGPACG